MLRGHKGTISIKDLSDMTAIKTEDILSTLQHLNLIQYQKGQHVLVANPKIIEKCALKLKEAANVVCSAWCCPRLSTHLPSASDGAGTH